MSPTKALDDVPSYCSLLERVPRRETPRTQSQRGASVVTTPAPSVCLLADHLAHLFESSIFRAPSQTERETQRMSNQLPV